MFLNGSIVSNIICMKVAVLDNTRRMDKKSITVFRKIASETLRLLDIPSTSELCLTFVLDAEMRDLNKSYRNIDRTTDVLSFPQLDIDEGSAIKDEKDLVLLGDVVISTETALRHSEKYGVTLHQEIKKLIVHGILHLLGHNHKRKEETELMRRKERELLIAMRDL